MDEKPVLIAREGQLVGERWTIDADEFVIGRGSDCHIMLPERQVSRYHIKILHENGRYVLQDLDSKNGTYLNGNQIKGTAVLQDGDEIQIALCVKLVFVGTGATLPLTFDMPTRQGNLVIDEASAPLKFKGQELDPPCRWPNSACSSFYTKRMGPLSAGTPLWKQSGRAQMVWVCLNRPSMPWCAACATAWPNWMSTTTSSPSAATAFAWIMNPISN
jgi:hypothetical protein